MEDKIIDKKPMVNLCITTFNRLDYTKKCIASILGTTTDKIPYLITVVDNGSTDGTPEKLKEMFDNGLIDHLILLKENIGISKAQNLGWKRHEEVPFYAKIDNDIVFNKRGWLDGIINTFEKTTKIGALGYQCSDDGATYPAIIGNGVEYRVKNGNIGGACFFVPKHINEKLGYWCEEYGKYGEEDADYGMRITVSGHLNCYMMDGSTITHLPDEKGDYRTFKDNERDENLKGNFWNLIKEYRAGKRPLKIETNILDEADIEGEFIR